MKKDLEKILNPRKALNKAFLKIKPSRTDIDLFKKNLINLLDNIKKPESEEFHKNLVSDFLKNTYFSPDHFINTKGRNDLVIHNGNDSESFVGIIIEAKNPSNKSEMIKTDDLNTKAFQELVLYFLRERITGKNLEIKYLIATNIYEWFIFDANLFEKLFSHNKELIKHYTDFEEGRLSGKDTGFFYKEIAEPFIKNIENDVIFTYFDIRNYETALRNTDKKDDNSLISLYKILSPEHLLKLPFANDSNNLDKSFYTELLHIIGLTETKEGSKKLIERKKDKERNSNSLLESTINQLDTLDKISRLDKIYKYGKNNEENLFNTALELVITWIDRILFLKLLEAQEINYHKSNDEYSFLNIKKIENYDELNTLFFSVLAKLNKERSTEAKEKFKFVPYLNSSLFEPTELEQSCFFISQLKDGKIPVISSTVLKDVSGKKRIGELNTLEYLFEFLNAYDFSSEGSEEIQEENKTLINASVLGLIFEKINGYKDGSFFTPGFITMYMCRETIKRAVVQKFNEVKKWNVKDLNELYNKIEDIKEANEIMNSLKICDPAVGSGHFLVSALNEIIAVKSDLNIFTDKNSRKLKEYNIEVVNDELVVTDENGKIFSYNPGNKESQRIQETLFNEKQTIIENCLFGVDINTNSVKICRLRLWIELLKNAYYTEESGFTELETLPNIDINIKCGNSLISRFDLDVDIKKELKKLKYTVQQYKDAVYNYKNASSKEEKRELVRLINDIKSNFKTEVEHNDKRVKKIFKLSGEYDSLGQEELFALSKKEIEEKEKRKRAINDEIKKIENEIKEIKNNKIYENAFEWRLEFPEVLNNEGDFVGFDVVIGNPPYIPLENLNETERDFLKIKYTQFERKYETSVVFIVKGFELLNNKGLLSYIAPATWQTGENYAIFRKFIIEEKGINIIINLPFNTFEDAYVDTSIYLLQNIPKLNYKIFNFDKKDKTNNLSNINLSEISISSLISPDYKIILNKNIGAIIKKLTNEKFILIDEITKSTQGLSRSKFIECSSYDPNNEDIFPFLKEGNVYNYSLIKRSLYYTNLSEKKSLKQFYKSEPKLLIRRIINRQNRLSVGYCDEKLVFKKDINPFISINKDYKISYLLGIMASKFISFLYLNLSAIANKDDFRQTTLAELRKIPIPRINENNKQIANKIESFVNQILAAKKSNPSTDTSNLEAEIDKLVYKLYGLTDEEIKIVED